MTSENVSISGVKAPRSRTGNLNKFLAEKPSRHVCARTWLPGVYTFKKKELLYNENAYDRYRYNGADEEDDEYDEVVHSEFTDYLQTIPHDESVFLRWIKESKEYFEGDVEKTKRAIMHPQLNQELLDLRASYFPKKSLPMIAETEFLCDEERFFEAEAITWAITYKRSNDLKLEVGLMDVELIEGNGMVCGPRRFYVRRLNRAYRPHHRFTSNFKKFVNECLKMKRLDAFPSKQQGLLVLYDQRRDKYASVIVVQNNPEDDYVLVYETETGRVVRVARKTIDDRLRAVPDDFDGWVIPESIAVELPEEVSPDEWQEFYNNLVENGKIYITAVDGYKLQVTNFEKVRPQAEPDKIYCRNIYCLGKCAIPSQWRHPPVPSKVSQRVSESAVPPDPAEATPEFHDDEWWGK